MGQKGGGEQREGMGGESKRVEGEGGMSLMGARAGGWAQCQVGGVRVLVMLPFSHTESSYWTT